MCRTPGPLNVISQCRPCNYRKVRARVPSPALLIRMTDCSPHNARTRSSNHGILLPVGRMPASNRLPETKIVTIMAEGILVRWAVTWVLDRSLHGPTSTLHVGLYHSIWVADPIPQTFSLYLSNPNSGTTKRIVQSHHKQIPHNLRLLASRFSASRKAH